MRIVLSVAVTMCFFLSGCSVEQPIGAIRPSVHEAVAGYECTLHVQTQDPDVVLDWTFDDGSRVSSTACDDYPDIHRVNHAWEAPGEYVVQARQRGGGFWECRVKVLQPTTPVSLLAVTGVGPASVDSLVVVQGGFYWFTREPETVKEVVLALANAHPVVPSGARLDLPTVSIYLLRSRSVLGAVFDRGGVLEARSYPDSEVAVARYALWHSPIPSLVAQALWSPGTGQGIVYGPARRNETPFPARCLDIVPPEPVDHNPLTLLDGEPTAISLYGGAFREDYYLTADKTPDEVALVLALIMGAKPLADDAWPPGDWQDNPPVHVVVSAGGPLSSESLELGIYPDNGVLWSSTPTQPKTVYELPQQLIDLCRVIAEDG